MRPWRLNFSSRPGRWQEFFRKRCPLERGSFCFKKPARAEASASVTIIQGTFGSLRTGASAFLSITT